MSPAPRPRGGDGPLFPEDIIWDIDGGEEFLKKDLELTAAESKTESKPGRDNHLGNTLAVGSGGRG